MLRKAFSTFGILAVSAAALLVLPQAGWAQHGGGHGGGGGGHGGGGGYHGGGGGYHGGGGGYHGGYGGYHGGYGGYHGYAGYRGYGYGYPGYYHHYGYYSPFFLGIGLGYPYYGSGYYGYPYYDYGYSGYGAANYAPDYSSFYSAPAPGTYPPYPQPGFSSAPAPAQPDYSVHVTVLAPPDAQVWFDGAETRGTGFHRDFVSPPLEPGQKYSYEVKARWMQDGQPVVQTRKVYVYPGDRVTVDFARPAPAAAGA